MIMASFHRSVDTGLDAGLDALAGGAFVAVTDDESRENEADLILAAEAATPDALAFMVRHTSGLICVGLPAERLRQLDLPLMVPDGSDHHGTAFTVSVDYRHGTTTGISGADRARTIRALVDPAAGADDFVRPGHVFPLRARPGGVLVRPGHTEASVDLTRLAGLRPGGALCELVNDDGSMLRGDDVRRFCDRFGLPLLTIRQLAAHRRRQETLVRELAAARLPTRWGTFEVRTFESLPDGLEHVALVRGDVADGDPVLVRVHSECATGDIFGSQRCDCGAQLDDAMAAVAREGRGVVVYLRGHEGRGIGLTNKLRAYQLQDRGFDTVEANLELGLPVDDRDYGVAAQILTALGIGRVRLLTNNPAKTAGLTASGLDVVERIPCRPSVTRDNAGYLQTKRSRLGHLLSLSAPEEERCASSYA
jgi:3,4-dihydroxy 2-butanone 4-phosphate synthase/GTP cyclohydrolase II